MPLPSIKRMTSIEGVSSGPATPQARHPGLRSGLALRFGLGIILPLFGLVFWEASVRAGWIEGRLLPAPSRIAAVFVELARSGDLRLHVVWTLSRVGLGFFAGAFTGTLAGAASGGNRTIRQLIDPFVQALRAVPSLAWVPLFILWFGIFEASKIALIAVGVFFPVYLGVMAAIASVDRKLIEVGRVFGLTRLQVVRRILLPAVLPAWIVALRTGLGLGFMFVVAAELMGASEGLGFLLVDGQQLGKPDQILVALITFGLVGQICDVVLVTVTRPLLTWQDIDRDMA